MSVVELPLRGTSDRMRERSRLVALAPHNNGGHMAIAMSCLRLLIRGFRITVRQPSICNRNLTLPRADIYTRSQCVIYLIRQFLCRWSLIA